MKTKKLKIGLLINSYQVSAWFAAMVEKINNSDFATIALVVLNSEEKRKAATSNGGIVNRAKKLSLALINKMADIGYRQLIERNTSIANASSLVDIRELLADVPMIQANPSRKKWSDYFSDSDLEKINTHQLDVLIRGGFRVLRGGILTAAKHGVWSFHHGDNRVNRGGPPGYWEVMENWPETGVILQKLTEDLDNGLVLYRSYSITKYMSVTDNKSNYYWKSLAFVPRVLKDLHRLGDDAFYQKVAKLNQHPSFYCKRLYTDPTPLEKAKLVSNKVIDKCRLLFNSAFFHQQWFLMYDLKPGLSSSFWRYKKIMPPRDRFWADPHIIATDNKYYIFIEELMQSTKKGHISVIEMDQDGHYQAPVPVLEKDYHLSYPFVFKHEGEYYMIPETAGNRTIELYKSSEFPFKWQWQMNLMENVYAVDATLHFDKDKWWLFANMVETPGSSSMDELFLFYSDDFRTTNWQGHKQNPVISDVKKARPAGALFTMEGKLYRPSQNCSLRYGYGFNLNHITSLTEDEYQEETVSEVKPDWEKNLLATHTFNKAGKLQIIDVQAHKFKFGRK